MVYTVRREIDQNGVVLNHQNIFKTLEDARNFFDGTRDVLSVKLYDHTGAILDQKPAVAVQQVEKIQIIESVLPKVDDKLDQKPAVTVQQVEKIQIIESVLPKVDDKLVEPELLIDEINVESVNNTTKTNVINSNAPAQNKTKKFKK